MVCLLILPSLSPIFLKKWAIPGHFLSNFVFSIQLKILTPLQKLPKNVGDLGELIVATGFEKLPIVQ